MLNLEQLESRTSPSTVLPSFADGVWTFTSGPAQTVVHVAQAAPAQVQQISDVFAQTPVPSQAQLTALESNFLQPGQGTVPPEMTAWDQPDSNGQTFQQADPSAPAPLTSVQSTSVQEPLTPDSVDAVMVSLFLSHS